MLNDIVIQGRLTRDPEMKNTASGIKAAVFTLACERDYKPLGGDRETDFFDVVAWRSTAEFVQNYFRKGRMVVVKGRLQNRQWTGDDGIKRKVSEIVADSVYFCDNGKDNGKDSQRDEQTAPLDGIPVDDIEPPF